jgi:hypothetical protein
MLLMLLLTAIGDGPGACFFGIMPENLEPTKAVT